MTPDRIVVRSYREVVGESPPVTPRDIEMQPLPQTFWSACNNYFGKTIEHLKTDIAPTIYSNTPQKVLKAVNDKFWTAPACALGFAIFGDDASWLLNAVSGGFAEGISRAKISSHDSAPAVDAAAGLLGLHILKGSYSILKCLRAPSLQNTLGAIFDVAATIKYASIITKLKTE